MRFSLIREVSHSPYHGELLISDYGNSVIRKVDMDTGIIMTIAGVGEDVGYTGDSGSPTNALLNRPTGIAVGQ